MIGDGTKSWLSDRLQSYDKSTLIIYCNHFAKSDAICRKLLAGQNASKKLVLLFLFLLKLSELFSMRFENISFFLIFFKFFFIAFCLAYKPSEVHQTIFMDMIILICVLLSTYVIKI